MSIWRGTRPGEDQSGLSWGASTPPSLQTRGLTAEAAWEGALRLSPEHPPLCFPDRAWLSREETKPSPRPQWWAGWALCSGPSLGCAVPTGSSPRPHPTPPGAGASLTIHSCLACAGQAGGPRSPRMSPRKMQVLKPGSPSVRAPAGGHGAPGAQQHGSPPRYSSVQFSNSVVSDSLRPHGLQHTRHPCPSPTPRVYPNACPSSW